MIKLRVWLNNLFSLYQRASPSLPDPFTMTREEVLREVSALLKTDINGARVEETGRRLCDSNLTGDQHHFQLVRGVWVEQSLIYETHGIPMGLPPIGRNDVSDKVPGTPESVLGQCGNCKVSWKWVDGHSTMFTQSSGCFPLCEKCWSELTPEQRLPFYRELFDSNIASARKYNYPPPPESEWELIKAAVLAGR